MLEEVWGEASATIYYFELRVSGRECQTATNTTVYTCELDRVALFVLFR